MNKFYIYSMSKLSKRGTLFTYLAAFSLLSICFIQPYLPASILTRDAVVIAGGKFYFGLISNIGILLWAAGAAISLFTFALLLKTQISDKRNMLLCGGLLTTFLMVDDFFLIHDQVFPRYLKLSELYVIALYPILVCGFLLAFRQAILDSSWITLFISLCFLGLSVVSDIALWQTGDNIFIEDCFKFLGIAGWSYFFVNTSYRQVSTIIQARLHSSIHPPLYNNIEPTISKIYSEAG